ncbi:MAG: outer membrane beta-barrel family protein [Ginsengibacter sp.]
MKLFFISILLFFSFASHAQIKGNVQDSSGHSLTGATLSLLNIKDSSEIKLAVSTKTGDYSFEQVNAGSYLVKASFTGYRTAWSDRIEVNNSVINVAPFKLIPAMAELKNVTVALRKPLIEMKADKMIMNVEGTINATGSDLLELLRKSPGINIDKDDNISMNAKNGVQVYIDGKPSPLTGQDLANYLKSLQSSQVATIEFITNPSAKYEAAGNAGIINIRLKKNQSLGLNGSVNAGYNIGKYGKYNSGINLNYRNEKVNIFGNYGYSDGNNYSKLDIFRNQSDSLFNTKTINNLKTSSHNFKAGSDFFINKNNILGIMISGNLMDGELPGKSTTMVSALSTKEVHGQTMAVNETQLNKDNINYNINYNFNSPSGKSLMVNADYSQYNSGTSQLYNSTSVNDNVAKTDAYEIHSPSNISIASAKADWEQNLGKGKLSFGTKLSIVKSDNDYRYYKPNSAVADLDKEKSNHFLYKENINAGYVNYNRQFKGFMIQAGVRAENTVSDGTSHGYKGAVTGNDSAFKRDYIDLFPSATINFNKKPENQVSLSYSRRIDRPSYQQLNPFQFNVDEYTFVKGNINLRPQYTNSLGLTYMYKYKLNATLNYSHVKDMMAQITDTAGANKIFLSTRNLAQQDVWSLNISYPFQYKSFSVFANINTNFSNYKAKYGAGRDVNLNAFGFMAVMQSSVVFHKVWTAQVTGFYSAPSIYQGTFKVSSLMSLDAGIQRQFLNKRMSVKASVSDIFNSLHFKAHSDFAGQRTDFKSNWESRQFKVSVNYRFGRNGVKPARQLKTGVEDESNRAKSGSGGISIGQ